MANQKADLLLQRITALHKSLRLDPDTAPSAMERDLMLGYLRELYDAYRDTEAVSAAAAKPTPPPAPRPAPAPVPPPAPAPALPPVVEAAPVTPAYTQPAPAPPQPAPRPNLSPELKELFADNPGDDLAARLGRQPIKDLTRAMTINNRVLFTNTLFDNNGELMNTVLSSLNGFGNFEQAQPTLTDLAQRHGWAEEGKKDTARDFIELVRRRYA